jgi:cob(I)alamin adenosyltransferase
MSITTKAGDKGRTVLYLGKKVPKYHIRIDICGVLDELSCYLGTARSILNKKSAKDLIAAIQKDLYLIAAEVATEPEAVKKLKTKLKPSSVEALERQIQDLEKTKKLKASFYCSGQDFLSSLLDLARAVARRAERRCATLKKKKLLKNEAIFIYLNRLSDLLFLLARNCERKPRRIK